MNYENNRKKLKTKMSVKGGRGGAAKCIQRL